MCMCICSWLVLVCQNTALSSFLKRCCFQFKFQQIQHAIRTPKFILRLGMLTMLKLKLAVTHACPLVGIASLALLGHPSQKLAHLEGAATLMHRAGLTDSTLQLLREWCREKHASAGARHVAIGAEQLKC